MGPNADNSPGGNRPPEDPAWRDQFRRPPRTPSGRAEVPHVTPGSQRGGWNDDQDDPEGAGHGPSPWADSLRRRTGRARQRAAQNAFTDRLRSWAQALPLPAALRPSDRPA